MPPPGAANGRSARRAAHFTRRPCWACPAPLGRLQRRPRAKERGAWTRAAAAYQRVRQQDAEDVATPATGCGGPKDGSRPKRAAGCARTRRSRRCTPQGHDVGAWLDEAREQLYQQAVAAEEAAAWDQCTHLFAALPAGHADAEDRGTYAKGRAAEDRADWRAAAEFYAGLRYADADARMILRTGRIAEFAGQWDEASARYGAAKPFLRDAGERLCYASGRLADGAGTGQG